MIYMNKANEVGPQAILSMHVSKAFFGTCSYFQTNPCNAFSEHVRVSHYLSHSGKLRKVHRYKNSDRVKLSSPMAINERSACEATLVSIALPCRGTSMLVQAGTFILEPELS